MSSRFLFAFLNGNDRFCSKIYLWRSSRFQVKLIWLDRPVWPDWAIYCTLGNFSKPAGTIILTKLPKLFGNFCKGVKIFHVSSDIILGNFYWHYATFYWSLCLLPIMTPPVLSLTFPIWILPLTSNLVYLLRVLKFLFVRLLRITQSLHSLSLVLTTQWDFFSHSFGFFVRLFYLSVNDSPLP